MGLIGLRFQGFRVPKEPVQAVAFKGFLANMSLYRLNLFLKPNPPNTHIQEHAPPGHHGAPTTLAQPAWAKVPKPLNRV